MINKEKEKKKYTIYLSYNPVTYVIGYVNVDKILRSSDGIKAEMEKGFITIDVEYSHEFSSDEVMIIPSGQIKCVLIEEDRN